MITIVRGLGAAALTTSLLTAAAPAVAEPAPAPERVSMPVVEAIAALPAAEESRAGYKRSSFKHWVDADKDGCNTRAEVLIAEATGKPEVGPGCTLTGGKWLSYYDGLATDNPRSLDIDHVVPLAEAWDAGASKWDAEKRERYANDLDAERSLVAVTAKHNRSKADKDPAQWWVPSADASCQYLSDWVSTKTRWRLALDEQERAALNERARGCSSTKIKTEIVH
ncbi:HNH endonuclease family protein [Streptomyces sp. NPDC054796]